MHNILIADDNADITQVLAAYTTKEGYNPVIAADGEEALRLFDETSPSAVLLDVMMPKIDGYEVCRKIREKSNVPIILVTARGEGFEKIMGLEIGADDYIVKPFSPGEIIARINAILRRITPKNDESAKIFTFDNLEIDLNNFTVKINDEIISFTKKEIEILWTLATTQNKVFTRENLLDLIWGFDYFGESRTVDTHIKRLRAKLDNYKHEKWNIKTIWGVGYKFDILEK